MGGVWLFCFVGFVCLLLEARALAEPNLILCRLRVLVLSGATLAFGRKGHGPLV